MMSGEAWLYLLAVLINAVNLFLQVFFTIMYSDLEWWVSLRLSTPSRWGISEILPHDDGAMPSSKERGTMRIAKNSG
jgi:hypothetical protein